METKQWTTFDKSAWGFGAWINEPDKIQWQDKATGLPCLIVRSESSGALCGYVGVAEGHPLFRTTHPDHLNVHGGVTFTGHCMEDLPESVGVCHIPAEGEPAHVWWIGFDCAHGGDYSPIFVISLRVSGIFDGVYRNVKYVKAECAKLAAQLVLR